MWLTIIIAVGIVCYILCDRIADAKNLGGWWGLAGLFFGIFALIAVAAMPKQEAPEWKLEQQKRREETPVRWRILGNLVFWCAVLGILLVLITVLF